MPYTQVFADSEPIILSTEIPSSLSGLTRPAAHAQAAAGAFGELLLQQIATRDFTLYWNHYYIKEAVSLDYLPEHPAIQIRIMLKGQERLHAAGTRDIHIGERQFYIIYLPGHAAPLTTVYDAESVSFTVDMPLKIVADLESSFPFLHEFLQQATQDGPCALFPQPGWITIEIESLLSELLQSTLAVTLKNYYYEIIVREMLMKLLLQKKYTGKIALTEDELNVIYKVRSDIEASIERVPTPDQLARIAGMPIERLKVLFNEVIGVPMSTFILMARLRYAKHLLQYTDMPVKQVAQLSGYTSSGNFIRAFRKTYRYTPNLLRKKPI